MRKLFIYLFLSVAIGGWAQTPPITRALNHGLGEPQDPSTLPVSRSKSQPVLKKTTPPFSPAKLELVKDNEYRIVSGWKMQNADIVNEGAELPFKLEYNTSKWYDATVPGTVLTTLVNEGVYPDPYIGLNNLLIPDTICNTDWWYRVVVNVPKEKLVGRTSLVLYGVNYRSEVWFNGKRVGKTTGAFIRGQFDVTNLIKADQPNILAVRVIPPSNPGIAHEQSIKADMGKNGGLLCLDGPTFFASQGWDWIPGIKDRNIGIWQDVCFKFYSKGRIGDPQIITDLPLPDTSKVDLRFNVPVYNESDLAEEYTVGVSVGKINIEKKVVLQGKSNAQVEFSSSEFPTLIMKNPKLWWPNGYGSPNLYVAKIVLKSDNQNQDVKSVRFGVREFDYQFLVDSKESGKVDIEFNPILAYKKKEQVFDQVNVSHINVQGKTNYIPLLLAKVNSSGIIQKENSASPYLVLKINGVRVFCKGGNWGMEDAMKRASRERLEPALKLHKDQNFNMIRNWTGQSTEEVLFDLCDEYGIMVFNDFWMSTTDFNVPPADYRILMSNIKDAVKRFRNHPSIAIWCARNEGFAPEQVERQLMKLLIDEDGTRHYLGTSIKLNTTDSGPWESHDPDMYSEPKSPLFPQGFKTEIGAASLPTYRTALKFIEKEDLWPMGDVWSYHDWHVNKWPGFQRFQERMKNLYGTFDNAEDFLNWSQLENYRSWRAMTEASIGNRWNNTTGFLYWLSHPSWYSTVWQTYSYDFETTGAYFGAKKACEQLHVQMSPATKKAVVINSTRKQIKMNVSYLIYSLDNKLIAKDETNIQVSSDTLIECFDLSKVTLPANKLCLIRFKLVDSAKRDVSTNDYWIKGDGCNDYKSLMNIGKADVRVVNVTEGKDGNNDVTIKNFSNNYALGVKLNLINLDDNKYVLPSLFSEGFFTMLPNEQKIIKLTGVGKLNGYKIEIESLNKR